MIFHIQGELRHRGFSDPFPDLTIGAFGVDLFFVISGFIMVYASVPLFGTAKAGLTFMLRRIARIAPLYWVFTAVFTAVAVLLGKMPGHPQASASHIVASFLFIPAARPDDGAIFPIYSLGWTLTYEMFFYLCFALAIGLRQRTAIAAVSSALIALVLIGTMVGLPWPLAYWAKPISLEFVFGMGVASAYLKGLRLKGRLAVMLNGAALAAALAFVPLIEPLDAWRGLCWGIPAAVLVAGMLSLEQRPGTRLARLASLLGDASYSLYLVHSVFFIAAWVVASRMITPLALPPLAYAAFLLAGSVLSAVLLFRLFEKPVTAQLNRMIRNAVAGTERRV